jgi:hypothetical protein
MAKRKWKAGQTNSPEDESFLRRFRKPIAIAAIAVAVVAFFLYRFSTSRYQYGDNRSDYNRALAECVQDRTRVDSGGDAVEKAADACLRDMPAPPGGKQPVRKK